MSFFRYCLGSFAPHTAAKLPRWTSFSVINEAVRTLRPLTRKPCRFFASSVHRYPSAGPKAKLPASLAKVVVENGDTPVHPHLRPPRKLRQISSAKSGDGEEGPLDDQESLGAQRKVKRVARKMSIQEKRWPIVSYCTAEEYRLDELKRHLKSWNQQKIQGPAKYGLADSFLTGELAEDAVHYRLLNSSSSSPRDDDEAGDVFIFSEGSVVFWNVAKEDTTYFLDLLSKFEVKPYERSTVEYEAECLDYSYLDRNMSEFSDEEYHDESSSAGASKLTSDGTIILDRIDKGQQMTFIKYAFSDAIVLSVKLAIYESLLQDYVHSIENVAEDMKNKGSVTLTKDVVLRKTGELFFLRHSINLGSDMLDPPDFYWDRQHLESLYRSMTAYLNIGRRTKIINEKLSHCYALVELIRDHLNNQHHVRLEQMIIALICVEVFFATLHYVEKYFHV